VVSAATNAATPTSRLTLLRATLKADSKGRFKLDVGCASEAKSCTGKVVVRRSGKLVLSRKVTVKAGLSTTVTVTPSAAARHSLARHSKLKFTVTLVGTSSTLSTKAAAISVRG
jgi:hypothetical protein